jgi:arginine deiminase
MKREQELNISVFSEVAPLKSVLLHRPGRELESLTPQYLDAMLFEDIPYLEHMRYEHNQFAKTLEGAGCHVYYVDDLLRETLACEKVKASLIDETVRQAEVKNPRIRDDLKRFLYDCDLGNLSQMLIGGVLKSEVPLTHSAPDLSYFIRDEYPYYISPLPNLYFTRDPGTAIGNFFSVNRMRTEARQRETLLLSTIFHHVSTSLTGDTLLEDYSDGSSIEGGDILVLNDSTLAIGCSARTESWAIERLAQKVLSTAGEGSGFKTVLVIQIPFIRAYMHLDTVFTMVDHDKFTIYPGVEQRLKVFTITKKSDNVLSVEQNSDMRSALKQALGVPAVDLIQTGGGDSITAAREQWNDSTNTLAVAPGRVVTYRRNVVSNETLTDRGIEVLAIEGSELVRGRGGPRCMSMPLMRSDH